MATTYGVKSFAYGELSEKLSGRTDSPYYAQGCKTLHNAFALPIGGAEKRPGTIFAQSVADAVILVPWIISPVEGRILEFGVNTIRYYKDGEIIESAPDTPVETATTYTAGELKDLRFAQIQSIMYIVHPSHKVAKLTRTSDTVWTLTDVTFTAGAGEQDFSTAGNYPSHVEVYEDRLILARTTNQPSTFWGSRVASYENFMLRRSSTVTTPVASPGIVTWTGHPFVENSSVIFTGGTLPTGLLPSVVYYVVGASITPNTFQVSATAGGAAINFTGTNTPPHVGYANPPLATDAWEKTPRAKANAEILWLLADEALLFGTSDGAFRVGGKESILTGDAAWWPNRQCSNGSRNIQALMVDDFAAFVSKSGKHLYRFQYSEAADKYVAENLFMLSDHLPGSGIIAMAHQREPDTVLWVVTDDGRLLSGCYSRVTNTMGWSEHDLSGEAESVAVIPTINEDEVWVVVGRYVEGSWVHHIEYFAQRTWDLLGDYHGVDGAVVWDGGSDVEVTSISNANPAVCTAIDHGFVTDDQVRFRGVTGIEDVNGTVYTVKNEDTDTFELYTQDGSTPIDFSGEASAGADGEVELVTNVVTGLDHLNGLTVKTLGDGSVIADEEVVGGEVTLDEFANKIRCGLGFTAIIQPMNIAEAQNRLKRVTKVFAIFYRTADAQISDGVHDAVQITFDGVPWMDYPLAEFTGAQKELFDGFADYEGAVRIESENPLPLTVLALNYEVVVGT